MDTTQISPDGQDAQHEITPSVGSPSTDIPVAPSVSGVTLAPRTLASLVHALPQELQDIIFGMTEILDTPATVLINAEYKPPVALQLNRKLRTQFASRYYSSTTFQVDRKTREGKPKIKGLSEFP